ncbi:MAG TPA: hypothetical protein V6D05_16350 [Stenomitos sp.]
MKRFSVQLVLATLLLSACASLDHYLPWVTTSASKGTKAATKVAEASITKALPTDPEYQADPWSFVLTIHNKTAAPLAIEYKLVFMDSHGDPSDVQYGQVEFPSEWSEYRKGVVPQALSSQAQVFLYLPGEGDPTPMPVPSNPVFGPPTPYPVPTSTPYATP